MEWVIYLMTFAVAVTTFGYIQDMYEHWKDRKRTDKWIHVFGIIAMWIVMWVIWKSFP